MSTNFVLNFNMEILKNHLYYLRLCFFVSSICRSFISPYIFSFSNFGGISGKRGTNTVTYLPCPRYAPKYPLSSYIKRILVKVLKTTKVLYLENNAAVFRKLSYPCFKSLKISSLIFFKIMLFP